MSYYIIEFFKHEIAQGLYIVRDGPDAKWQYVVIFAHFFMFLSYLIIHDHG